MEKSATNDGWLRIVIKDKQPSVSGHTRFFKGYVTTSFNNSDASDGIYVRWNWDGEKLDVSTCYTGFIPLFYYYDNKQIVVSTRIKDIFRSTGLAPIIDYASLGVLLRLGFPIGNSTPFEGVNVLGPQGRIVWRPGEKARVTWAYPSFKPVNIDREEVKRRYVDLFRASMRKISAIMSEDFTLPLSGGRDSRHIALELSRMGRRPRFAVTAKHLPPRRNEDARIAGLLCKHLGWPHVTVAQPLLRFRQETLLSEVIDFQCFEHAWTLPLRNHVLENGIPTVFDGVGGDVLSAGLFQVDSLLELYTKGKLGELSKALVSTWQRLGGEVGINETVGKELIEVCDTGTSLRLIEDELARHSSQPNPLKSFYFWNRTRRSTGLLPFKILGNTIAYAPYLDKELLDLLLSLPPSITEDKNLHTETIELADASIGSIAYESKSAPIIEESIIQSLTFFGPLAIQSLKAHGFLNAKFVVPRAARNMLVKTEAAANWWNPRRVAYLAGLSRFIKSF